MQKAKKMSKQTLVIAVLAVLLVLSLALSVTGAWFTDTDSKASSTDIQFGTVKLGATSLSSTQTLTGSRDLQHILPGDTINLSGSVATDANGSTVKIYVAIYLSDITVKGTSTETVTAATADSVFDIDLETICNPDITATNLSVNGTPTAATPVTDHGVTGLLVYTVEANAAASISLTGSVKFENSLKNNYTSGSTRYILNDNGADAVDGVTDVVVNNVRIKATMNVAAIQFDNIEKTAAINELKTLVGM